MNLNQVPLFRDLDADQQAVLMAQTETRTLRAGEVLFYEGDLADKLYVLAEGKCMATRAGKPQQQHLWSLPLIDPVATLGGLPHHIKLESQTDSMFLYWPVHRRSIRKLIYGELKP